MVHLWHNCGRHLYAQLVPMAHRCPPHPGVKASGLSKLKYLILVGFQWWTILIRFFFPIFFFKHFWNHVFSSGWVRPRFLRSDSSMAQCQKQILAANHRFAGHAEFVATERERWQLLSQGRAEKGERDVSEKTTKMTNVEVLPDSCKPKRLMIWMMIFRFIYLDVCFHHASSRKIHWSVPLGSPRTKTQLGRQGGADKATGVISGAIFTWFVMVVVDYTCDLHVYVWCMHTVVYIL